MNFLSLEYFLAVAQDLSITKAAEKLFISQQSLSNSIIKLEKVLGVKLFNRSPSFSLTYAGSKLVVAATKIMDIRTQILNEIDDASKNHRGEIRIGISHTRGCSVLPEILPRFKETHPLVKISLVEANSEALEEKLNNGGIDLMFGFLPIMLDCVKIVELFHERMYLVVPKRLTDELFGDKSEFMRGKYSVSGDISAFKDCPMIMLKQGNRIRAMMDEVFAAYDITPNIVLETDNIETAFALAARGMGITVYPEMYLNVFRHGTEPDVDLFPLADKSAVGTLAIGYSVKRYLSTAARDFIRLAEEIFLNNHSLSAFTTV